MDIQTLLGEAKKEETRYVPCTMPMSLYGELVQIREAEGLSMSGTLVLAARLLVENYDGSSPQETGAVEGGGEEAGN